MPNIFDSYLRGKQGALNQGQNAFAMEQFIQNKRRDDKLRNVLSSAYQAPMAQAPAAGPVRPGETLQDYPAQAGGYDPQAVIQDLARAGMGDKAFAMQQQMTAAKAPMALEKYKHDLKRQAEAERMKQFSGMLPGGGGNVPPGYTMKMTPRGPELAYDPVAASAESRAQQQHQYQFGGRSPAPQSAQQPTGQARPDAMMPPAMIAGLPQKMQDDIRMKQAEASISSGRKEVDMTNKARIEAKLKIPTAIQQLDQSNAFVNDLLSHKGLESAFGIEGALYTVPGTEKADFETMKNQLKNSVFITNREALKGGGSITDYEGNKAEESALRADRAQSPEAFRQALKDYQFWTERAYTNLERAAQGDWSVDPNRKRGPQRAGGGTIERDGFPSQAVEYLRNNNNSAVRQQFKAKYGKLPEGM